MGVVWKIKWISTIRICAKKARLGGLGISLCPTHQGGPFFAQTPDRAYPFSLPHNSHFLDLVHFYEMFL